MPSWRMRFWSSTSHARPASCAMARARAAMVVGVSLLGGSTAILRARLRASAITMPRLRAFCRVASTLGTAMLTASMRFGRLFIGFVAVGLPGACQNAFGDYGDECGIGRKRCVLHSFALEKPDSGGGQLQDCGCIQFFGFARARYQHAPGCEAFHSVKERKARGTCR